MNPFIMLFRMVTRLSYDIRVVYVTKQLLIFNILRPLLKI